MSKYVSTVKTKPRWDGIKDTSRKSPSVLKAKGQRGARGLSPQYDDHSVDQQTEYIEHAALRRWTFVLTVYQHRVFDLALLLHTVGYRQFLSWVIGVENKEHNQTAWQMFNIKRYFCEHQTHASLLLGTWQWVTLTEKHCTVCVRACACVRKRDGDRVS